MIDWEQITNNPVDKNIRTKIRNYLEGIKKISNQTLKLFLISEIRGKSVLDVGIVEHDLNHLQDINWKHKYISKHAKYCLGIDLIENLLNELRNKGYNVKNVDATSDYDLKQKFDVIILGDLIEHVSNQQKLLEFSKRHLAKNGKIIVTTPNPWQFYKVMSSYFKGTVVNNVDHVVWISPANALELARRANLNMTELIYLNNFQKKWYFRIFDMLLSLLKPEAQYNAYCYIFRN